jgi:predicted ATP-grasp superfamily ATP-dependent carboligase
MGYSELKEGAVLGVTGALMLKASNKVPLTYIFAETNSKLPDSRAAAEIVKVLNEYLSLKIDIKPLIKKAKSTEEKIKAILKEGLRGKKELGKKSKDLSYVG